MSCCVSVGMTPLLVAAYEGHHTVCELLLEGEADVDACDNNGRTPLFAAASMGHSRVVSLLLFWGAAVDNIDSDGRTVLSLAALQGTYSTSRYLTNICKWYSASRYSTVQYLLLISSANNSLPCYTAR